MIRADLEHLDAIVLLFSVARYLERLADHATNIAEDVLYMVEGEIQRHHQPPVAPGTAEELLRCAISASRTEPADAAELTSTCPSRRSVPAAGRRKADRRPGPPLPGPGRRAYGVALLDPDGRGRRRALPPRSSTWWSAPG